MSITTANVKEAPVRAWRERLYEAAVKAAGSY